MNKHLLAVYKMTHTQTEWQIVSRINYATPFVKACDEYARVLEFIHQAPKR